VKPSYWPAPVRNVYGRRCQHRRASMPTTYKFTVSVVQTTQRRSVATLVATSNTSPAGWARTIIIVQFGVPQGSVLGPLLFVMYTADVVNMYADDIQVYSRCHPNDLTSLCRDLVGCIKHVASWMGTNHLQLNAAKTEFTWFVQPRRRHQFPSD